MALPMYSQLKSLVEAMPGQSPVPFHSFPRVKQAVPVCSPYKLLFGSQTGQTGTLPRSEVNRTNRYTSTFGSCAGRTGTLPYEIIFESQVGNPCTLSIQISIRKLSQTNRYTSTQNHFREPSRANLHVLMRILFRESSRTNRYTPIENLFF